VLGDNNTAIGNHAGRFLDGSSNVALGNGAGSGTFATPILAANTVSIGTSAIASRDNAIAIGNGATVSGTNSTAIGNGASTGTHTDAAAFGNGATASSDHQQMFGTASNSYTMAGINTASTSAQSGPVKLVTADGAGTLGVSSLSGLGIASAGDIAGINSQIAGINNRLSGLQSEVNQLGQRDKELASGIAISMALAQPILLNHQNFAMRAGWGNFDGTNALGFTGAGVITRGYAGPNTSIVLDAGVGVGTDVNMVAGRAGLTFGW